MKRLSRAAWLLVITGIGLGALGNLLGWHAEIAWFDEVLHLAVFFALSVLIGVDAHEHVLQGGRGGPIWSLLIVAGAALALGALWEVAEWLYDMAQAGNVVRDMDDTMVDLIVDSVAALAGSAVVLVLARRATSRGGGRLSLDET